MLNKIILLAAIFFCYCGSAFGWGKSGHDAIAYIAECNLTPKAKKNIEKYLDHSIVYDATWMDTYRHTPAYKHTSRWHTANVNADGQYVTREGNDAVYGIEQAVEKLRDYGTLDDSTVVVSIRYLVHLVADMHCPTHVKYPGIKSFNVFFIGKETDFHGVWDSYVLDANHRWGYIEYQHQLDRCTKAQKQAIAAGTPREWLADNARACRVIYEWCKPRQEFDKNQLRDMLNAAHPLAEQQVLKAGYRLAGVLNELFG